MGKTPFLAQFAIQQIIDFRDPPVFPDAAAYPLVLIARHAPSGENHQVQTHTVADMAEANEIATAMRRCASPQVITSLKSSGWVLQNPDVLRLLDKIRNAGRPLGEVVDGKFDRVVLNGFNEAFVIDEAKRAELIARDPKSDEIIKPFHAAVTSTLAAVGRVVLTKPRSASISNAILPSSTTETL